MSTMMNAEKAIAPFSAEEYVFALGPEVLAIAETELRETEELRNHGIQFLRDWIDKNPKIIKCRYDTSFLLRFLRARKYSLPAVQLSIERTLMLRQNFMNGVFLNISLDEPNVMDLMDRGFLFPLPKKDKLGRKVLVAQPRVFDFDKHTLRDLIRIVTLTTDTLSEDEENQVRGYTYLIDAAGASLQFLTIASPSLVIKFAKHSEAIIPMRHCLGVGYNIPSGFKIALDVALSFLSEKLRSRIRQVTDLSSTCPELPADILPKELGGTAPESIPEMIKLWKEEINSVRHITAQNSKGEVNVKLFTEKELDAVFDSEETAIDDWGLDGGIAGSFRKIQVD